MNAHPTFARTASAPILPLRQELDALRTEARIATVTVIALSVWLHRIALDKIPSVKHVPVTAVHAASPFKLLELKYLRRHLATAKRKFATAAEELHSSVMTQTFQSTIINAHPTFAAPASAPILPVPWEPGATRTEARIATVPAVAFNAFRLRIA
jgi:hypothetical protein